MAAAGGPTRRGVRAGGDRPGPPARVRGGAASSGAWGGWPQVRALRRKGSPGAADARILGSGEFAEALLRDAAHRETETLRLVARKRGMGYSGPEVARFLGVTTSAVNRLAVSPELLAVKKFLKAL